MEAIVLQKACIRCGLCPTICPEVFSLEDGESAQAAAGPIPDGLKLAVQEAGGRLPRGGYRGAVSLTGGRCRPPG